MKKIGVLLSMSALLMGSAFAQKLSYDGYTENFRDDFDGKKLNTKIWNYEFHEPGWVNNELQSYGNDKKNTYLDGNGHLVIQPLKKKDKNGNVSYSSGRINTQGKMTRKFGIFEARLKVPKGQGYLPAFWMMPDNESLYGNWPLCGEIDIMEVLGNDTDKSFHTLHFGRPHKEKQVSKQLESGDFASEFHLFSLEWLPDEFKFYVDGEYVGSITEWFTKKEGDDPLTFPAPYDQPYYLIFNVAVGGNWPGMPDETTTFDDKAQMVVDYVRVLQKAEYDENVTMKVADVKVRGAGNGGNYVRNGNFAAAENLADGTDWQYMSALGGEGSAKIANGAIEITTNNPGTVDYSIQLVQADIPLVKGGLYEFSFDAWSTEDRSMMAGITGPDNGYVRYFGDVKVNLTSKKQTFRYPFQMKESTDANCRIDYNMGATSSKAPIFISNVSVKQVGMGKVAEGEKSVTADGNYIYNGTFDKGDGRMKYWTAECADGAKQYVSNVNNIRECVVEVTKDQVNAAVLSQGGLPLIGGTSYMFSLDSKTAGIENAKILINGKELKLSKPVKPGKPYTAKFEAEKSDAKSELRIVFEKAGKYVFDNVRISECSMVKNPKFENGMSGWDLYAFNADEVSCKIDNGARVTIKDTTDTEWKIQLKQNDVTLEKGVKYRLSFDVSSTIDRKIKYALQRDGARWKAEHGVEDWTAYNAAPTADAKAEKRTVVQEFVMAQADDDHTILTFSMGQVDKRIKKEHVVTISNIVLEPVN